MLPDLRQIGMRYEGELPSGWKVEKAGVVCTKITDGTHNTPIPVVDGRPYVTAIHIKDGKIDFSSCLYLDEADHREIYNRCNPQTGDLAVVNIGAGVGECGIVNVEFEFSMKNVALLKPNPKKLDSAFLLHLHLSRKDRISHVVRSGGAQPFLSLGELKKLPIILPPLSEQKKIAEILSTWDRAIAVQERLVANARAQKKALMQTLLTPKKRLPGFKGEWKKVAIKSMGSISSGGTPDSENEVYWNGHIPWTTPTDITALKIKRINNTRRKISAKGLENCSAKLLPVGTLLICTRATIGDMAIAAVPISTNQGFKNLTPNSSIVVEFLFHLFTFYKHILVRYACGSTFLELSKFDFEKREFRVPTKHEQKEIANVLESADLEIESFEHELKTLRQTKSALMQQLLTGKRRVKVEAKA